MSYSNLKSIPTVQYCLDILERYNPASKFIYSEKLEIKKDIPENLKAKVRYRVFVETTMHNTLYYNIFLFGNSSIPETCKYLSEMHGKELGNQGVAVFVFRKKNWKGEKGLDIIRQSLKTNIVLIVEDILRKISQPSSNAYLSDFGDTVFDKQKFIMPVPFILPSIKTVLGGNTRARMLQATNVGTDFADFQDFVSAYLNPWIELEKAPILLIKGDGGIGKTTVAQNFGNRLLESQEGVAKIFINSIDARNYIQSDITNESKINLYDLYKGSLNGKYVLDSQLFKLNLDVGNFFLIIDGIDELISKINSFDIESFFDSLKEYNSEVGNMKIIITCRSYFWEGSDIDTSDIDVVEILPFDRSQATAFFNQKFASNPLAIEKCMKIAEDFHKLEGKADEFHPYALDVISRINDEGYANLDSTKVKTQLLNTKETVDYIVYRICRRENFLDNKVRILDLSVDDQVRIFRYIAVKHGGSIELESLHDIVASALNSVVKPSIIEALKSHVLLKIVDGQITFSYTFLYDFYRGLFVANFFDLDDSDDIVPQELLDIFATCTFGASISMDVAKRILSWSENELLKASTLKESIAKMKSLNEQEKMVRLSGFFNLLHTINSYKLSNTKRNNTLLLEAVYGRPEGGRYVVENLVIANVYDKENKIVFDFRNKVLKTCAFINYPDFWYCDFDSNVYFDGCILKRVGVRTTKKELNMVYKDNVYRNCEVDSSFSDGFLQGRIAEDELKFRVLKFIGSFFRFFYYSGSLWPQPFNEGVGKWRQFEKDYAKFGDLKLSFEDFLDIVNELEIVDFKNEPKGKSIFLRRKYHAEIKKMIEEDTPCEIASALFERVYAKVKPS